ncbi:MULTISPECIES: IS1/IS1595 family N-terminal zinc-binding domain-containing protein [Prevotella]|uniref:IS1/IS1595 family N-terminal zinc-binding domain-containing protein n=1 Tax=Prevotella TaxID=838 RepID=UPI0009D6AECA
MSFNGPHCHSNNVVISGKNSTGKQRYRCKNLQEPFYYRLQHTKPIFLTLITDQRGIGQSQHDTNAGHYDLSAFTLVYP